MSKKETKESTKKQGKSILLNIVLICILLVLLNVLSSFVFFRWDLTSEKRFTLHPATRSMIEELPDIIYVKVYLEGDLPASYRRLRNSTKELLDEFRAYNKKVEYSFINPSISEDENERKAIYKELIDQGLTYTTPVEEKNAGMSQTLLWPGAIITYRNRSAPVQLMGSVTYASEADMLERSINDLEYNFANAINKLQSKIKPKIAFIEGHGELDSLQTKDITLALQEYYTVDRIVLDSNLVSLVYRSEKGDSVKFTPRYKAIIIAKPEQPFAEKDKFVIDQYVMRGGKVLWSLDRVAASMDSLGKQSTAMVYPMDVNLDDMLFRYGVRLNGDLVMDLRSAGIPLVTGNLGNQPKMEMFRWYYFPLAMSAGNHPISSNLNAIRMEFANSIDTVGATEINKTVLLSTSKRARRIVAPARISLNTLRTPPDQSTYNEKDIPLAVLLEGKFSSVFRNRIIPELRVNKKIGFLDQAIEPGAMVVVSDGDAFKNAVSLSTGKIAPAGLDRYSGEIFANKDFLLNVINYLCDDSGLIGVRSRNVKLRLLDETKIKSNRFSIQVMNVAMPIGVILLISLGLMILRRKRYGN